MREQTEEPSVADDDDADRLIKTLEAALEAERAARVKAEAERDRLVTACVTRSWRATTEHIHGGYVFEWRLGSIGGFFYERDHALDAVRQAAGLEFQD